MTTTNPHHPLVLTVLQHVSTDRLQRAVNALADGSLTVTLTRQTEVEIRALVKNGEGKEYGVTLTTTGVFCSCPDTMYREGNLKACRCPGAVRPAGTSAAGIGSSVGEGRSMYQPALRPDQVTALYYLK